MGVGPFFGKYRGVVINNQDPQQLGRLMVSVPDIAGDRMAWATPCIAAAGDGLGFFALPPIGAGVWVEFEKGDVDLPIWSGCYFRAGEFPSLPVHPLPPGLTVMLQTLSHRLWISDDPGSGGGIVLGSAGGARISLTAEGIEVSNGQGACIRLVGSRVDITSSD